MNHYELVITHIGHQFYPEAHEKRREKIFKKLGDAILVLTSNPISVMSNDVEYPYRQNSDLYYLTGFEEAESAAIFFIDQENNKSTYYLFVRPRDKEKETWTGKRYGVEGAKKYYGPTEAFVIDKFSEKLEELLKQHTELIFNFGVDKEKDIEIINLLNKTRPSKWKEGKGINIIKDVSEFVHPFRLIKDEHEISLIKKACEISAEAHIKAMESVKPGMWEYQLQTIIEHYFIMNGAKRAGYPTIVGSGENATILHYTENNHQIKDGDLVLIDAGAEYMYYNSDITRTFPANGEFSNPQKELYELVYKAQQEAFKEVKPGSSLISVHNVATKVLVEGMIELGLLEGTVHENIDNETYKEYYMHGTGHWLGIDVHDAGRRKYPDGSPVPLEPGMIFTVEPGIYVSPDSDAPEKYKGIGIRIEDDVLVTKDGLEILTTKVPSKLEKIEELIQKK